MVAMKLFFFFAFLILISNEGPCAITTRADKYLKCRDKEPSDTINSACCFLKSNDIKACVEIRREDIKNNWKKTKEEIINGEYDYWNKTNLTLGLKFGTKLGKLDSLRCNNSQFLQSFTYFAILFIFF